MHILTASKKVMIKMLNLKLAILLEYQNKNNFPKGYTPNWSGEVFVIRKAKNTVPATVY